MIVQTKIDTYRETLMCNDCGTEMLWDGRKMASYPPQYLYECPKCGFREVLTVQLPRTIYQPVLPPA